MVSPVSHNHLCLGHPEFEEKYSAGTTELSFFPFYPIMYFLSVGNITPLQYTNSLVSSLVSNFCS